MIDNLDTPERDFALLTRHRTMRPVMSRLVLAELASGLPLDELKAAHAIFQTELDGREGRRKFMPPMTNAARRADP